VSPPIDKPNAKAGKLAYKGLTFVTQENASARWDSKDSTKAFSPGDLPNPL
jgi:hypothetical protein